MQIPLKHTREKNNEKNIKKNKVTNQNRNKKKKKIIKIKIFFFGLKKILRNNNLLLRG